MFHSNGQRQLSFPERALLKVFSALRRRSLVKVVVDDRDHSTFYICETSLDAQRAVSLWLKESGTMDWIESEVRPGDVFLDVGANIGIYSIAAALRMGARGKVYAFEPHKTNALSLLRNVQENALAERIQLFSCALSDSDSMLEFNYLSLSSASSSSQLGHRRIAGSAQEFTPAASEKVYATSVDSLLQRTLIEAPTLVKIDVDGNESAILRGMHGFLRGPDRPRSVQVELNVGEQEDITTIMQASGYRLAHRHLTYDGKRDQAAGKRIEAIAHNAVFVPAV